VANQRAAVSRGALLPGSILVWTSFSMARSANWSLILRLRRGPIPRASLYKWTVQVRLCTCLYAPDRAFHFAAKAGSYLLLFAFRTAWRSDDDMSRQSIVRFFSSH
jgi:hypothetical protein